MTTTRILTLTLLVTTLSLGAALPKEYFLITKQQTNSISNTVANILYRRGIEEDKALELSHAMISIDEELFALMLNNLVNTTQLNKDDVLEYFSKQALQKKSVNLTSYSSLVKISQTVKNSILSKEELQKIEELSQKNELLTKVFS